MTKNCVSKTGGHRELMEGFENLGIDGQTDRQAENCKEFWIWKPIFILFVTHFVIHFFQPFMNYTAVYQQQ
jgi:hypothetical protein